MGCRSEGGFLSGKLGVRERSLINVFTPLRSTYMVRTLESKNYIPANLNNTPRSPFCMDALTLIQQEYL